jgi:hypothetical protein
VMPLHKLEDQSQSSVYGTLSIHQTTATAAVTFRPSHASVRALSTKFATEPGAVRLGAIVQRSVNMLTAKYFVIRRNGAWFVTIDGTQSQPYGTEAEAVAAAISTAQIEERAGTIAEVSVDEPEDGIPLVYRTDQTVARPAAGTS